MQRFVTSNLWVAPKEKKIQWKLEHLFGYVVKMECSIHLKAIVPNKRQEGTLIFWLQSGQRFQKRNTKTRQKCLFTSLVTKCSAFELSKPHRTWIPLTSIDPPVGCCASRRLKKENKKKPLHFHSSRLSYKRLPNARRCVRLSSCLKAFFFFFLSPADSAEDSDYSSRGCI